MILICPNCNWQDLNVSKSTVVKPQELEGGVFTPCYIELKCRCMKCGWEGLIATPIKVTTTREGR